jgi:hypothetical protein
MSCRIEDDSYYRLLKELKAEAGNMRVGSFVSYRRSLGSLLVLMCSRHEIKLEK